MWLITYAHQWSNTVTKLRFLMLSGCIYTCYNGAEINSSIVCASQLLLGIAARTIFSTSGLQYFEPGKAALGWQEPQGVSPGLWVVVLGSGRD